MAWLHAAPKRNDKDDKPPSRFKTLKDGDPLKDLPEINEYYAICFQLSGMFLTGAMGIIPLTWAELDSFVSRSAYPLSGFEAENIITMSREYCNFSHKAKELGCAPPYNNNSLYNDEDSLDAMRDKVARQWESFESKLK